jgi:hypothetical protein
MSPLSVALDFEVDALRRKSAVEIQDAVAKALNELTGTQFDVSIGKIDFDDVNWARRLVRMDLTIRAHRDKPPR